MRRVLVLLAAAVAVCLGAAGCTSSSSSGGSTTAPASHSSSPSSASTGTPVAPARLAASLQHGLSGVRSVRLGLTTKIAGSSAIDGSGDVALSDGTISKADISEQLPGGLGSVRLIVADGSTYARLPAGLTRQDKPWTRLSSDSSQPLIAQLAQTVDAVVSIASPSTVVRFVSAASSVTDLGPATVGGVPATHYLVVIPGSRLASLPGGVSAGGAASVPVELYTDAAGRPVRLSGSIELSGAKLTPTVSLSRYGEPVSITAPPASQVAHQ